MQLGIVLKLAAAPRSRHSIRWRAVIAVQVIASTAVNSPVIQRGLERCRPRAHPAHGAPSAARRCHTVTFEPFLDAALGQRSERLYPVDHGDQSSDSSWPSVRLSFR